MTNHPIEGKKVSPVRSPFRSETIRGRRPEGTANRGDIEADPAAPRKGTSRDELSRPPPLTPARSDDSPSGWFDNPADNRRRYWPPGNIEPSRSTDPNAYARRCRVLAAFLDSFVDRSPGCVYGPPMGLPVDSTR